MLVCLRCSSRPVEFWILDLGFRKLRAEGRPAQPAVCSEDACSPAEGLHPIGAPAACPTGPSNIYQVCGLRHEQLPAFHCKHAKPGAAAIRALAEARLAQQPCLVLKPGGRGWGSVQRSAAASPAALTEHAGTSARPSGARGGGPGLPGPCPSARPGEPAEASHAEGTPAVPVTLIFRRMQRMPAS